MYLNKAKERGVEVELQAGEERGDRSWSWSWSWRTELLEEMGFGSAVDVTAMAIHPLGRKKSRGLNLWRWRWGEGVTRRQQSQKAAA